MALSGPTTPDDAAAAAGATGAATTGASWRREGLAVCLGGLAACYAMAISAQLLYGPPFHNDFVGIWSWARFEIERPAARIYDHAEQQAFLDAIDPLYRVPMPFPYPPPYLLLIRPLGWLPLGFAQPVWIGLTLLGYLAAIRDRARGWQPVLLGLLAPAVLANLVYGQNGFLTTALLVGGMRLATRRPVAGGVLLGLLSYKPQFGLLVVIALAAARRWRTAGAAAVTVAALVAASLAAFGMGTWMAWLASLPDFTAIVDGQRARLLHVMPTVLANALATGAPAPVADFAQICVTAACAAAVWFAFRRGPGATASVAVLAAGAALASPYAFVYDLSLVSAAIALWVGAARTPLSPVEIAVALAAFLLPAGMVLDILPPLASVINAALLIVMVRRLWREDASATPGPS